MPLASNRRELSLTRQLLATECIHSQFSGFQHIYTDGSKSTAGPVNRSLFHWKASHNLNGTDNTAKRFQT